MPIVENTSYEPPRFLRNNLAMYFWASTLRRVPTPPYERFEKVPAPAGRDGSFFELAWWRVNSERDGEKVALIAPGLSGTAYAQPTRGMARALHEEGWDVAVWVFRDTGEVPTTVRDTYSGYGLDDLNLAVELLAQRYEEIALVGTSLGANHVLQYVCQNQPSSVSQSVAISPPIAVGPTVEYWSQALLGKLFISCMSKRNMTKLVKAKAKHSPAVTDKDVKAFTKVRVVSEVDHYITSDFNGYSGAWEYWHRATTSTALREKNACINLLIVTAKDDPMLESHSYPHADALGAGVTMELTTNGSHIGFVPRGWRKHRYWSEQRVIDHLASQRRF